MAEPRRVQLTTLSHNGHTTSEKEATVQKHPTDVPLMEGSRPDRTIDTVRLELALFEPDDRSFPEFSYSQLLESKIQDVKVEVPLSRFEVEEKRAKDEAAALAKKLKGKYGGKSKKKDRIQDLIDIGYGYDEEDSFIDNSEAYDEFVPASITTKFGGFYVNSGVLQFRQASDTEDLTTVDTSETSKKRKLDVEANKPKKKWSTEDGEIKSNVDASLSASSETGAEEMKKKKKKVVSTLSVTSMLKKFQREKEKERQKLEKANQTVVETVVAPTIPLCPADAAGGGGSGLADPLLCLIGSTNDHALIQAANTVEFDIDLDSLLEASEGTLVPQPATEVQLFHSNMDDHSQAQVPKINAGLQLKPQSEPIQLQRQTSSTTSQGCAPLPEGLPPALEDAIRKLTVAAKKSEGESALKFFTPEINSILLETELQCREHGGQMRSKVYTHLSSFLPCSKETLLKRVRKLLVTHMEEESPDVEDPMHKLKEAIGKAMPEQIILFHEKCQEYEQVKTAKAKEEENEGKRKANDGPEDNLEEKSGKKGVPKKLFKWNDEIRECLCQVLKAKVEKYKKEKGSQELEEYLKTLLDNEVKPLWPKGWMQSRVLMRENRSILSAFTYLPVKKTRPEKKQPSISGPPTQTDGSTILRSPPLGRLSEEKETNVIEGSPISRGTVMTDIPVLKQVECNIGILMPVNTGSSTPAQSDEPLVTTTSVPALSLLDLLADQALAREQTLVFPQQLLAAAVTKYHRSFQHWSLLADTKSPPLPPPPPQSSPVGFSVGGVCQGVLPHLLQMGDFARLIDATQVIPDDADITIQ